MKHSKLKGRAAPARERSVFSEQIFTVDGLAAAAEYVRFRPEALVDISCKSTERRAVEALLAEYRLSLPVRELSPADRDQGKEGRAQAPVEARVKLKAREFHELEEKFAQRQRDVVIALDHVTDPRNLGAIVRSAAFFGVSEVLVPERRQVLLTGASVATAQGGFALTDLVCVVNLGRALDELRERGYWLIGTAMDGESYHDLAGTYDKVVLVMGAEDHGLSHGIRERCDRLAAIQGAGSLDSLNVAVSTGIFLSAFKSR